MGVKFGMQVVSQGPFLHTKFHPINAGAGIRASEIENFTKFWHTNACRGISLARFLRNFQSLWTVPLWVKYLNVGDLLEVFRSYGCLTSGMHFPPNIQCRLAAKLYVRSKNILMCSNGMDLLYHLAMSSVSDYAHFRVAK